MLFLLNDHDNLTERKKAFKFPNVAADLLSTANEKTMSYFSQQNEALEFPKFNLLLDFFKNLAETNQTGELNFTRAGYVCKVLNSLLLEKTGLFLGHILIKKSEYVLDLLRCCNSKSVSCVILNLLTLLPSHQQNPVPLGAVMAGVDGKADAASVGQSELRKETFEKRLEFFGNTIEMCVEAEENNSAGELHANLANILMTIINKDFPEQMTFLKALLCQIPFILNRFCETFKSFTNNKLGNIYLVLLEVILKDTTHSLSFFNLDLQCLNLYTEKFLKMLCDYFPIESNGINQWQLTPSFSNEIPRLNPKVYKVMEAIIVTLKWQTTTHNFDSSLLLRSNFEKHVFQFFESFAFNNILHNQLKKLLFIIVERGNEELVDQYFCSNPCFFEFVHKLELEKTIHLPSGRNIKKGFVGHMITLTTLLCDKSNSVLAKLSRSSINRPDLEELCLELLRSRNGSRNPDSRRHRVSI